MTTAASRVPPPPLPKPGEPLSMEWLTAFVAAHNEAADELRALRSPATRAPTTLREVSLLTGAAVADSFPLVVGFDRAVVGLRVVRVGNLTDLTALFATAVFPDWEPIGSGVILRHLTGLAVSTRYLITVEAVH